MATHDYVIANGTGAAVRSDLNGALAAIVSNNSSATTPATTYAYQWWADTTTGLLKLRNSANSAWITIGTLASANLGLLSLAGDTMTGVLAVTAGTAALPGIAVSGDTNTGITSPGADQLAISTGGTGRLFVDGSGNVGVGLTPSAWGTNRRGFQIGGNSSSALSLGAAVSEIFYNSYFNTSNQNIAATTGQVGYHDFNNNVAGGFTWGTSNASVTAGNVATVTTRVTIQAGGAMLVPYIYATTSASAANVIVGSDGSLFRSTSSARYKTNIETLQNNYADAILDCRPVWYRSISKIDNPDHGFWGFIAEEVAEIDPRLVFWKTSESVVQEDGSCVDVPLETPEAEGVQYDRFVPHLLNLIKRQGEAIADLQAEVSALKGA